MINGQCRGKPILICMYVCLSQMPCLEQTSAIMILHLSLSSVIGSKAMLSLMFPVTKELKLSRNVILCLPLLLVPSILPVRDKNSSPLWRHIWPKNFSCLFLIVFMRDLSWFVSSNINSFVLFSFHDILFCNVSFFKFNEGKLKDFKSIF